LYYNGQSVTEERDKAIVLNNLFSKNFTVENNNLIECAAMPVNAVLADLKRISPTDIVTILSKFKNSFAVGPDGFSAAFYKRFAYELCYPLSVILNTSVNIGKLPTCWKRALVIPVFKKGNAADPSKLQAYFFDHSTL